MTYNEKFQELLKAKAAAEKDMEPVIKDSANPFCKNRYASLAAVLNVVKPALVKHGLILCQSQEVEGVPQGVFRLNTELAHLESGQGMCILTDIPLGKADAQGVGSAFTYARRYALMGLFNLVAEEDDDGNKACGRTDGKNGGWTSGRERLIHQLMAIRDQVYRGDDTQLLTSVSNFLKRHVPVIDNLTDGEMAKFINACQR